MHLTLDKPQNEILSNLATTTSQERQEYQGILRSGDETLYFLGSFINCKT